MRRVGFLFSHLSHFRDKNDARTFHLKTNSDALKNFRKIVRAAGFPAGVPFWTDRHRVQHRHTRVPADQSKPKYPPTKKESGGRRAAGEKKGRRPYEGTAPFDFLNERNPLPRV